MKNVIHNIFEVVKFHLEVAEIGFYTFREMDFAEKSVVNVCFEAVRWDEATDLTENGEVSD
jgi:hypothetical protein